MCISSFVQPRSLKCIPSNAKAGDKGVSQLALALTPEVIVHLPHVAGSGEAWGECCEDDSQSDEYMEYALHSIRSNQVKTTIKVMNTWNTLSILHDQRSSARSLFIHGLRENGNRPTRPRSAENYGY
ncbi:hypothetical protein PoB_007025700 [Plakobranchus ocellatus]|uniref:Uncharacterized protein n=1 Tax=Plakobranchus ocellatus TaxID=259542 RepID=A0AAV4DHL6_9GAST|nr:hypothetical protein PoB_007025700 [Plakobranchus ocellatus]